MEPPNTDHTYTTINELLVLFREHLRSARAHNDEEWLVEYLIGITHDLELALGDPID